MPELLFRKVYKVDAQHAIKPFASRTPIVPGQVESGAGVFGAAAAIRSYWHPGNTVSEAPARPETHADIFGAAAVILSR